MRILAGLFMALALIPAAFAASLGSATAGLTYSQTHCATCHAINRGETRSPVAEATPFQEVATRSGMTATALLVWMQTSHPTMPNLIVAPPDLDDVIAYVLSLKAPQ